VPNGLQATLGACIGEFTVPEGARCSPGQHKMCSQYKKNQDAGTATDVCKSMNGGYMCC
jgi:hypothetical protein